MPRAHIGDHHKDQLLDVLFHHMSQELRAIVMREVPLAYNAYVGREIVRPLRVCDLPAGPHVCALGGGRADMG